MIEIVTLISVILFLVVLLFTPILPPRQNYKNIPFTNIMRSPRDILNVLGRDNNSVRFKTPNKAKIMSFEWDCGGFNNVRMAFEVACAISIIFDRTIVMPPKAYWDHMPKGYIMDLSDFYDLDSIRKHVPLISSSEYLGKTATYDEFKQIMSSNNGLSKELLTKLPQEYQKLSDKQQEPVWFFLSCKKENGKDMRIFGNFNSIFRDSPKLTKIRYTIKNGMKFKSELLDLVPNIPPGSYDAVHARLGDFQYTYEKDEKNPIETLQRNLTRLLKPVDNSHKLLIITPEKDRSKFDSLKKDFDIQFLQYHQRTPSIWVPLIDILACVSARRFLGNKLSTFTYYIQILRGYCTTNRQKDFSRIIDDTPEYHNANNESIVAKIGKAWNCSGNCWDVLDTEQWLDHELKAIELGIVNPKVLSSGKYIISFCVFGKNKKYTHGAVENAIVAPEIYPGWICRFYIGDDVPEYIIKELETFPHVEIISMPSHVKEKGLSKTLWRFQPLFEDDITAFVVRDTDSILNKRGKTATDEWLNSDKKFHIMRDHKLHRTEIMGGMWGCKGHMKDLENSFNKYNRTNTYGVDQEFLRKIVYPRIKNNVMIHARYKDLDSGVHEEGTLDFPLKANEKFVGKVENDTPRANKRLKLKEHSTHFPLTKTAFYMNLDKDTRRNRHIQTLLNSIGFENINRITPIKDPIGWKSLTKSHKYILEQISNFEKEEYYFVFEDDIALAREENPKNVFNLIKSEMDKLISAKMSIPFIYLGACLDNNQWGKCTNNKCNTWCAHAYMLTPNAAKWLLKNVPDWENNIIDNNYLQILNQPLVGHKFTHDHTSPQWRGLFYQGRKESWYTNGLAENGY